MSAIDFHPEDLLDRAADGTITPEENVRLTQHLAQCGACRLERQLAADFEAELAPYEGEANLQRFVSGALLAVAQPKPEPAAEMPVAATQGRPARRSRTWAMLLAATMLFVSGLAAAQAGFAMRVVELARDAMGLAPMSATPAPAKGARRSKATKRSLVTVPTALPASASVAPVRVAPTPVPSAVDELAGKDERSIAPAHPPRRTSAHRRSARLMPQVAEASVVDTTGRTHATAEAAQVPASTEPAVVASEKANRADGAPIQIAKVSDAQSLFERANAARRRGRWLEASALYRDLASRFAESAEARLSLVLAGRMRLDHGDTRAALASFEAYLATRDTALREEAMIGRAIAYDKLGRDAEERASVEELLRAYPDSPYGALAQKRAERDEP